MNPLFAPGRRVVAAWSFLALSAVTFTAVLAPVTTVRAADPATFSVGAFTFKRPSTWTWVPVSSSMRKAQLRIANPADPASSPADVVFFHFGAGQGGSVDSNISRWLGQFDEKDRDKLKPIIETAEVKGTKITRVRVSSGTFSSGMPGGPTTPMTNYGLYGAIIESAQGDVYVKMTGPTDLVNAATPNFEAMVQSPF